MELSGLSAILGAWRLSPDAPPEPLLGGLINQSFIVPAGGRRYLLQRINPAVFPDGSLVLANSAAVTDHLLLKVAASGLPDAARLVAPVVRTENGAPGAQAPDRAWWRLTRFIDGARSVERAATPAEARAVGHGFGRWHALLADYAGPPLSTVIPGFHDTPARLASLDAARRTAAPARLTRAREALADADRYRDWAPRLSGPALPGGIAHHDAKAANLLLDVATGADLAVVDLDTVMPGTPLYDVGDLIRSVVGTAAEDAAPDEPMVVDLPRFTALVEGFAAALGHGAALQGARNHWVTAGVVITYEQGLRFLTDFLDGDRYYRTTRPGQNLDRALAQFRLVASLLQQRDRLEEIVARATA